MAEEGVRSISTAANPGAFLVDMLPWLKYVPDWMPFAGFKRKAKEWRKVALAMLEKPFEVAKQKFVSMTTLNQTSLHSSVAFQENGAFTLSFISYSLENMDEGRDPAYQEEVIKGTAGALYTGKRFTCVHCRSTLIY